MGIEISLLSFIPFIINKNKVRSEAIMKYFIVQRVASTIFLFRVIYILIGVSIINEIFLTISILIKLGSAPFHNWVIIIIETIDYSVLLILLTIIKVPSLSIMYQINTNFLVIPIIIRIVIRSISCLNQSSIRKTLGYSSIYNIRIMLSSINKFRLTLVFLTIYTFMLTILTANISNLKVNFINQIVSNEFNPWLKFNLWINMLSLGGFPPLIGFVSKIIIIQILICNIQVMMLTVLVVTSILVIIFYTRLAFTSIINFYSFKKWIISKNKPTIFLITINISITPMLISLTLIS